MAFIYSARGEKIPMRLSTDDVAIRFAQPDAARGAGRALRAGKREAIHEATPRVFRDLLMLRDTGVAHAPIGAVARALPRAHAVRAERSAPVYVDEHLNLRAIATAEISVRFKKKTPTRLRLKLLASRDLKILRKNEFHPAQYIVVPTGRPDEWKTVDIANALHESPEVEYAAPNFVAEHRKYLRPNDPLLARQWYLANDGRSGATAGEDVGALLAWDITPGGDPKVVIAIIDDGVDLRHPDLKANIWTNPTAGAPDRHGRNFYDPKFPNDPNPRHFHAPFDDIFENDIHGTCCAGVAAAVGGNAKGVAGIAYRCTILPVKVFGGDDLATDESVANAIRYAGQHAAVISCSWGTTRNPDLESAVKEVARDGRRGKGSLIFCATGNERQPKIAYPALYPGALGVGASNDQGRRAQTSNFGPGIEFVAPSSDDDRDRQGVTTTDVSQANRGLRLHGAYTDDFGGTSSATPLAAGIAALILSVNPRLTRDEVRNILRATADKIDATRGKYKDGYSNQYGHGRLNAHAAVARAARRSSRARTRRG
jgi:subtilisin family serine protease